MTYEAQDWNEDVRFEHELEQEEPTAMNDRSTLQPITFPAQREKLPPLVTEEGLLDEHEVQKRADLYWRQHDRINGYDRMDKLHADAVKGYRRDERNHMFAVAFWGVVLTGAAFVACIGLYGVFAWVSHVLVNLVMGR